MRSFHCLLLAAATAGSTESAAAQISATAGSLSGTWAITIGTPQNPEYRSLDVAVGADGSLTGSVGSPNGSVPIKSGRLSGSQFTLLAVLGTGLPLSYEGTVIRDTIRGTWRYDKFEGRFVGRRGTVPPPADAAPAPRSAQNTIDAEGRRTTIDSLAREIEARYIDTALARRVATTIRERARSGAYDTLATRATFARGVTLDLRQFDKHFGVIPVTSSSSGPNIQLGARDNFGVKRVERLDGNVGYLKFDVFGTDTAGAANVLRTALRFLARADALIVDLRENRGGAGAVGQLLLSYFVPGPARVTADLFTRTPRGFDSTTVETATRVDPDMRFAEQPLYVLTSPRTASAAEWLAYNLQALKRARVVGEISAGAAHPIQFIRLNGDFDASIPIGRARSRITKTDFEGLGVQPDLKVSADQALSIAHGEALRTLLSRTSDPLAKAEIERALANIKS